MLALPWLGVLLLGLLCIRFVKWAANTESAEKAKAQRKQNGVPEWLESGYRRLVIGMLWCLVLISLIFGVLELFHRGS